MSQKFDNNNLRDDPLPRCEGEGGEGIEAEIKCISQTIIYFNPPLEVKVAAQSPADLAALLCHSVLLANVCVPVSLHLQATGQQGTGRFGCRNPDSFGQRSCSWEGLNVVTVL